MLTIGHRRLCIQSFCFLSLLFLSLSISSKVMAQVSAASIDSILTIPNNKKDLHINYVPFKNVIVLDNRFDTTAFFSFEDGKYPLITTTFAEPASVEIKNYIDNVIADLRKGNDTYLFNIKQLRIGNKHISTKLNNDKKSTDIRANAILSADVYRQVGGNQYLKVLSINTPYLFGAKLNELVAGIINSMIEASALTSNLPLDSISDKPKKLKGYQKENSGYTYFKEATNYGFDDININARNKWSEYPINKAGNHSSGYYKEFNDFKNNAITAMPISLSVEEDNTYKIASNLSSSELKQLFSSWALCDSNSNIFIRLSNNKFVKLVSKDNTFYFKVPNSMPNMYSLLSMQDVQVPDYAAYGGGGILGAMIGGAISSAELSKKRKKIAANEMKQFFRECFIDMDTGDIIYNF